MDDECNHDGGRTTVIPSIEKKPPGNGWVAFRQYVSQPRFTWLDILLAVILMALPGIILALIPWG